MSDYIKREDAERWLNERSAWLDKEIRHGGDMAHLSARFQECRYAAEKIAALPSAPVSEQNTGQDLPSEGSGLGNVHRDASQRGERSPAPVYSAPVSEEREEVMWMRANIAAARAVGKDRVTVAMTLDQAEEYCRLLRAPRQAEPVAWLVEWPGWKQYHDEDNPLPTTWDVAPAITPLYAAPPPDDEAVRLLREILNASEAGAHLPATDIRRRIREFLARKEPKK